MISAVRPEPGQFYPRRFEIYTHEGKGSRFDVIHDKRAYHVPHVKKFNSQKLTLGN